MKNLVLFMIGCIVLAGTMAYGQGPARTDVVWARTTTETMTLDGVMNEPGWASAESIVVNYGVNNGSPGSGWFHENGLEPPDNPTHAVVKFLVKADSLYVGIRVSDHSVGGGPFNQFDGILANLRQRDQTNRPVDPGEIFYAWVKETWADTMADQPSRMPFFGGFWGSSPYDVRPDSQKVIWDAATTVQGTQNNDADVDSGYTMEFKLNLKLRGYHVSDAGGDIVMYSLSIYDADYEWPLDTLKQSGNRVWYQCPWGNAAAYNHIRVYARPDVGLTGALPAVGPEGIIPGAGSYATPVLDGKLDDAVWNASSIGRLQIQFGNSAIRDAYPSTGPYRSGQFQPSVNGGQAAVVDPNLATIKYFYKADTLFLGFDVDDAVVQASDQLDRWDGFRIILCQRDQLNGDNVLFPRRLTFRIDSTAGKIFKREDDLGVGAWDSLGSAVQIAVSLKPGTTIDTLGQTADAGYTAEMRIVLTKFGYPSGRGDGVVFFGAVHYDGDSFPSTTDSYGTRAWFMREGDFNDGAAWWYMDPAVVLGVDETRTGVPATFALLGNYPNPFNPSTTIKFTMPQTNDVVLEVFNVLGQLVATQQLGQQAAGEHEVKFNASRLASGMYSYRLRIPATNAAVDGKMMLLK
jgi:Secretion system C-terminal sorting domain